MAIVCGILSALAKPMAVTFPIILGLCDIYRRRPLNWFVLLEKAAIGVWFIPIGWITLQGYAHAPQVAIGTSVLLLAWSLSFYFYKFLAMNYFVLIYKTPHPFSFANPVFLSSLLVVSIVFLLCVLNRKNRLFLFAIAYYLGSIFLVLRWDYLKDLNMVADRFMYLPSVGICLWLGAVFTKLIAGRNQSYKKGPVIVLGVLLILLIFKTHQQILVWKNSVNLWEHQLSFQPQAATALSYNKLAQAYTAEINLLEKLQDKGEGRLTVLEKRLFHKIIRLYQASLAIKPDYTDSLFRLAQIYEATGETDRSRQLLLKVIKYDPRHFDAYFELGQIYLSQGQRDLAFEQFRKAVAVNPGNHDLLRRVNDLGYYPAIEKGR